MNKYQLLAIELIRLLPNGGQRAFLTSNIPEFSKVICYNLLGNEINIIELTILIQSIDQEKLEIIGSPIIDTLANGLGFIIQLD